MITTLARSARRLVPLVFAALVSACATLPPPSAPEVPAAPATVDAFALNARVAVASPNANETFRLRWQRLSGVDRIEIYTPIGTKAAELLADGRTAELWQGDSPPRTAADLDGLLADVLGTSVPTAMLTQSLVDRAPNGTNKRALTYTDWAVDIEYHADTGAVRLVSGQRGDVRVRLVVESLTAPPAR